MSTGIMEKVEENLRKYVKPTEDGGAIDKFGCPVPDCDYTTHLGPGALRMHMLMSSDPKKARYDKAHDDYVKEHGVLGMAEVAALRALMPV